MRTSFAYGAALQLLVLPSLAMGQTAPQPQKAPVLTFAGRIPLQIDGRIDHTSIDLAGQRPFSSVFGPYAVVGIDSKTNKGINQIHALEQPPQFHYFPSVKPLLVATK